MNYAYKLQAIVFLPLLPFAVLIDVLIGDFVTGVDVSAKDKLREHRAAWLAMWRKTPNVRVEPQTTAEET